MAPVDIRPPGYIPQGTFSGTIPGEKGITRRRRLADILAEQGSSTAPVQSWTQGAARVAQSLASVLGNYQANQMEGQRLSVLGQALSGNISTADLERLAVQSGDASLLDILKDRRINENARDAAKLGLQPIWGKINGKLVAMQPSNEPGSAAQQMQFPEGFVPDEPVQWMKDDLGNIVPVPKRGNLAPSPAAGTPAPVSSAPGRLPGEPDFSNIPPGEPLPQQLPPGGPSAPSPTQDGTLGPIKTATPAEKARGAKEGALGAEATASLPAAESNAKFTLDALDALQDAPGYEWAAGDAVRGNTPPIYGEQADFINKFNNVQSRNFLAAYDYLRGAGHISEQEGESAKQAMSALSRVGTREEFDRNINLLREIVKQGVANARAKAQIGGGPAPSPPPDAGGYSDWAPGPNGTRIRRKVR